MPSIFSCEAVSVFFSGGNIERAVNKFLYVYLIKYSIAVALQKKDFFTAGVLHNIQPITFFSASFNILGFLVKVLIIYLFLFQRQRVQKTEPFKLRIEDLAKLF